VGVRFKTSAGYDYHAATFREELGAIVRQIDGVLDVSEVVPGHGWQGYGSSLKMLDSSGQQVAFLAYGVNPGVHVQVSGDGAESWVDHLQREYPTLHTTRIDSAVDWAAPGLFDRIIDSSVPVAASSRIKILSAGDWHSPDKSRTLYFGAPSSRVRVRLYEKGAEVLEKYGAKIPNLASLIPAGWVRLEVQIRPDNEQLLSVVHRMPAVDLFGASKVSRSIIAQIDGVNLPKLRVQKVRVPLAVEQGYQQALTQYGPTLARYRAFCGDDAFIARMVADLDRIAAEKGI
jgi:DNA relaxase NicK